jgi:hypothetical protein
MGRMPYLCPGLAQDPSEAGVSARPAAPPERPLG